jgi:acetoacetate decarboxylase
MSFVKSMQWLTENSVQTAEFYDAEMLTVYFETTTAVVEALLPPPLKPASVPLCFAFVAHYPRTSFRVKYRESALFMRASFQEEEGYYCLSMPVTDDMAMVLGREIFGYPKKLAHIELRRSGKYAVGWTERHGVRFMDIRASLTGRCNDEYSEQLLGNVLQLPMDPVIYNFKYFPAPDRLGFDYNPRLVREVVNLRPKQIEIGTAEITLRSSDHDPWGDVEVIRVLGAVHTVGNNTMQPGSVVAEVDQMEFAPYAFMKLDVFHPAEDREST